MPFGTRSFHEGENAVRLTCQACCPACGMHFSGDRAHEMHLGGPDTDWRHRDPRDVLTRDGRPRLVAKTQEGECRHVVADRDGRSLPPIRPVVIWQVADAAERGALMAQRRDGFEPDGNRGAG